MSIIDLLGGEPLGPAAKCQVLVAGTEIDANPTYTFFRAAPDAALTDRVILIPRSRESSCRS